MVVTNFFFFQAEDGIRYYKVTGVQTCALRIFIEGFALRYQVRQFHVPQGLGLEPRRSKPFHSLAALLQPHLIFRLCERPSDAGITDDNFHVSPEGDVAILELAAIEEQGVVLAAERRNKLVHDAARHADEFVFSPASELDERNGLDFETEQPMPEDGRAHFDGRPGAEPRLARHVSAEYEVRA